MNHHHKHLRNYNFLYGIIRDVDSAEDLSQETFMKVFTHKDSYRGPYKFSTWMYTIGKNLALTELRKLKRRKTSSFTDINNRGEDWGGIQVPDPADSIDVVTSNKEKSQIIQKLICLK